MKRLLLMLVLLCACKTTALHSTVIPGLWLQRVHDANTKQPCLDAPELLACAEKQALVLLQRAVELGYAADLEHARQHWRKPMLCLIENQEPCCVGSVCAQSSSVEASKLPRAGCTYENASWIARRSKDELPYDYSSTLQDELKHSIANMLNINTSARHVTEWDQQPSTEIVCNWKR